MNFVEQHTWTLMRSLILELDPNRDGWCIDAGAGVDNFYFQWLHDHGYKTILVEPLPTEHVRRLCSHIGVPLLELALDSWDGVGVLHTQRDGYFHSMRSELWGETIRETSVLTMTLPTLLELRKICLLTALKLDIEGAEPPILEQLDQICLPTVLSFEWGGVWRRHEEKGPWSKDALAKLRIAVARLPELGYQSGLVITNTEELRPLDYADLTFQPNDAWGNIVVTTAKLSEDDLRARASGPLLLR